MSEGQPGASVTATTAIMATTACVAVAGVAYYLSKELRKEIKELQNLEAETEAISNICRKNSHLIQDISTRLLLIEQHVSATKHLQYGLLAQSPSDEDTEDSDGSAEDAGDGDDVEEVEEVQTVPQSTGRTDPLALIQSLSTVAALMGSGGGGGGLKNFSVS